MLESTIGTERASNYALQPMTEAQFVDVVTGVLDPSVLDDLAEAICKRNPTDLGVYCIDMSSQTIVHKWSWNAIAEPPAPFKSW